MDKSNITIATITWARNAREEKLLTESLRHLADLQIPVFVCDGGSGTHFLNFLKGFPHFTIVPLAGKGVYAQAKSSLLAAKLGTEYILYTEPDKQDFFTKSLPCFIENVEANEQAGIVLASRSETAFRTFPAFQQSTETTINNCCFEIIGKPFDYTYGPFLFKSQLVPYLELIKEDIGWGWRPYTFSIAHRLSLNIQTVVGNFECPIDQREDNGTERIYRMRQLSQNIQGIVLSTSVTV